MSINIQIEKIHLVIILVLVFLGIGVFVINALSPGVAPNPGHLISETAPPSPCSANQFLQWAGSAWQCITPSSGITTETDPTITQPNIKDGVSWSEISSRPAGLDDGDQVGLTSASLSCTTISQWGNSQTVNCPSGYTMTGGGIGQVEGYIISNSYPSGNGWYCSSGSAMYCYVRCCKVI